MDAYILRVTASSAVNLALLVPFFALAFLLSGKGKSALKPVLLFVALFVLDIACIWLFKWVQLIPAWGHYNWQGKVLEIAWPVLLAFTVPMFSAVRTGLVLPAERRSWRVLPVTLVLYALIFMPIALLFMGAHFGIGGGAPTFAYEATMPGLGEEFVYRGALLMLLNEAFGRPWKILGASFGWGAVIVTAMFGFLHGIDATGPGDVHIHWSGMIFPALVGAVLAWLRERTGSVWPGVLFHNFVNVLNHFLV